jgi:tRNA nucleotidyltransferase (CCA-adding enzyme)
LLLKKAVKLKMLLKVQPQRIRDDLILVLKENNVLKEIKRIQELAGFNFIDPELKVSKKTCALIVSIKKQIQWFKKNYTHRRQLDIWLLYFMGLCDSLSLKAARRIFCSFAFRKGEEKRVISLKIIKPAFIKKLSSAKIRPAQVFGVFQPLSYETILALKAKYLNPNLQKHIADFFRLYNDIRIHIRGEDLRNLGIRPGPEYKKIFSKLLKAKVNGEVNSKEEERGFIQRLISR